MGEDRERLWQRWRELDQKLDGYAARRPRENFVPVNKVRWQLGRAGLDFGTGNVEVEFLAHRNRIPEALILKQKSELARRRARGGGFVEPEVGEIAG